jgi:GDP-D-mannose dehydratase
MKKVALITGFIGQDGAYLAEFILQKGDILRCVNRRCSLFNMACFNRLIEASVFNVERLAELGWQYTVDLEQGLSRTYQ